VAEAKKTLKKTTTGWSTLDSKSALPVSGSGSPRGRSHSPQVKEEDESPPPEPKKKRKGGLMTAADIAAEQAALAKERDRIEAIKQEQEGLGVDGNAVAGSSRERETIYRSAQGQKIDVKAEKTEQKRREKEEREKEAERMEWGKGLVQRRDREERALREKQMAGQQLAR
jgi:pre-mRNA-splicing factor CWC26